MNNKKVSNDPRSKLRGIKEKKEFQSARSKLRGIHHPTVNKNSNESFDIIFDLGGVVVEWKPEEIINSVYPDSDIKKKILGEVFRSREWHDYDKGTLTKDAAVSIFSDRLGISNVEICRMMNFIPQTLTVKRDTVKLMENLIIEGHNLYCLSNMNPEAYSFLSNQCTFWELFSGTIISSKIKMVKPDTEIFYYLLNEFQLNIEKCVFIDDTVENIESAERLGIRSILFEGAEKCECILKCIT